MEQIKVFDGTIDPYERKRIFKCVHLFIRNDVELEEKCINRDYYVLKQNNKLQDFCLDVSRIENDRDY